MKVGGGPGLSYDYGVRREDPDAPEGPPPADAAARARDMVLLLMILAAAFLFLSFSLNWEINRRAFQVVRMSDLLRNLGTVESSVVALALSAFVVSLPEIRKRLWFKLTVIHAVAIILGTLLVLYLIIGDLQAYFNVILQTFVLVFYSAPLIFGLFGILHHRSVHLVISAMFSLFIAAGVRNPADEWPMLLAFGLFFLLFLEVSESSIRCWHFLDARKLSDEHLAGFVDRYLRNLAIFMSAGVLLTIFILQFPLVVGTMGLKAVSASLELGSPYGQIASAVVVLGGLGLLRFLHDRGYTAPWIRRLRKLAARVRGTPLPEEPAPEKW